MNSFSIVRKKTPFQKHKEEEEAKKKRDKEENERLYKEFVESFQGDSNAPGSKTFVRGGTINPNEKPKNTSEGGDAKDGISVPKKGSRYAPSFIPPSMETKRRESEKKEEKPMEKEKEKGKTRNIDKFMEELKNEQERRDKRNQEREQLREGRQSDNFASTSHFDELLDDFDSSGKFPGSFDDGDPQTTNLYVGNLSPQVDENFLLRTFGRFGPIASVKIMWPRKEEEKRRERNCGFVSFMNRSNGQAAKDEMQGVNVYGYDLKIGWGKSISLPSQALPVPPPGQMAIRNKEGDTVVLSGSSGLPVTSVTGQNSELVLTPNVPDIIVVPPNNDHFRHVIDTTSLYVLDGGCAFEQSIMERGRGNQTFNFLFDLGSKEHTYYIWRLYSFAQGDTLKRWRTEPFIMLTGSGRWIPPPLSHIQSPEHDKQSNATFAAGRSRRVELECTLTDSQRDEFEDILRGLTLERSFIKEAMGFALDNADAAGEIVEVLTESLTLKETLIPTKVARLMLVSDILHNSSAPVKNASAYRTNFEAILPDIMESFNDLYHSITGRITAEALKERILKVLQVWADWFLFSDAYVNGLKMTFLRPNNSGVIPFHSLSEDALDIRTNIIFDGNREAATKELLGLPLVELERHCRHNGLSLCGGREMMIARLLNLMNAEKLRGLDCDDDTKYNKYAREDTIIVGSGPSTGWSDHDEMVVLMPNKSSVATSSSCFPNQTEIGSISGKPGISEPVLPGSKWTHVDGSDEDKKGTKGFGLNYSSSTSRGSWKRRHSRSRSCSPQKKLSTSHREKDINVAGKDQFRHHDGDEVHLRDRDRRRKGK